jgi:hypothetical protein
MKSLKFVAIIIGMTLILAACANTSNEILVGPSGETGAQGDEMGITPENGANAVTFGEEQNPNVAPGGTEVGQGPIYDVTYEVLPGTKSDELVFHLTGNLPTSCSKLVLSAEQEPNTSKILVVASSSEPEGQMCAQVLTPFDEKVSVFGLAQEITISSSMASSKNPSRFPLC